MGSLKSELEHDVEGCSGFRLAYYERTWFEDGLGELMSGPSGGLFLGK